MTPMLHILGGVCLLVLTVSCKAQDTSEATTRQEETPGPEPTEVTDAPKTCPEPATPVNGKVVYIHEDTRLPGSKVKFECNNGYVRNGDEIWQCSAEASWPNVTAPSCEKIPCGALPDPEHGEVSYQYAINVTATFTCHEGFTLEGSEVRICKNKKWSGEETKCSSDSSDKTLIIIIVVIVVVIVVCIVVAAAVYFFMKKRKARSREVSRPAGGAYQAVETKAGGDATDVEMAAKPDAKEDGEKDK